VNPHEPAGLAAFRTLPAPDPTLDIGKYAVYFVYTFVDYMRRSDRCSQQQ
jgi:hypothetical protein